MYGCALCLEGERPAVGLSTEPHAMANHFAGWPAKRTQLENR